MRTSIDTEGKNASLKFAANPTASRNSRPSCEDFWKRARRANV